MANKNDNKSLFVYTALIFIVAVLLIILSFFGQTNLKNSQPVTEESTEQAPTSITEKAAVLSEENKNLLEENNTIKAENEQLKAENDALVQKQATNDLLLSANGYYSLENGKKALEILNTIDYDTLSVDQQIIYYNIINNLQ